MRSLRLYSDWPTSHPDYQILDWSSEDYDCIIRHFGCFPYGNLNGNQETSALRGGRVLRRIEDATTAAKQLTGDCWWKIRGDKGVFDKIDYDFMMFLATVRITKDKLALMYEITKGK